MTEADATSGQNRPRINIQILFEPKELTVTKRALDSILLQMQSGDSITVFCNGYGGPELKNWFESVQYIHFHESGENLGVAGGRSRMLQTPEAQSADIIVHMDNDAIVPCDYLDRLVEFVIANPDMGVGGVISLKYKPMDPILRQLGQSYTGYLGGEVFTVYNQDILRFFSNWNLAQYDIGPFIDHMGGHKDQAQTYFEDRETVDIILSLLGAQEKRQFFSQLKDDPFITENLTERTTPLEVSSIPGNCQFYRREVLEEVGALDDLYSPYGYEDVDFALRARESGYRNLVDVKNFMFHGTDDRHSVRGESFASREELVNRYRALTILDYKHNRKNFPRSSLRRIVHIGLQRELQNPESCISDMRIYSLGVKAGIEQLQAKYGGGFKRGLGEDNLTLLDQIMGEASDPKCQAEREEAQRSEFEKKYPYLLTAKSTTPQKLEPEPNSLALRHRGVFERLAEFENIGRGKRCFIIGNGPSLKKTDFSYLWGEDTFGVNGIFYMSDQNGFLPTYYTVEDNHVVEDNINRINAYPIKQKFFPERYEPSLAPHVRNFYMPTDWSYYYGGEYYERPRFSHDLTSVIYTGQTVTYLNLQMAHYMGYDEVYVIGLDFSYAIPQSDHIVNYSIESQGDDPNHFHPEYFGKGKKWHFPKLHNCLKAYRHARKVYDKTDRKLINATKGGMLNAWQRQDFEAVVGSSLTLDRPNEAEVVFTSQLLRYVENEGNKKAAVTAPDSCADLLKLTQHYGADWVLTNDKASVDYFARVVVSDSYEAGQTEVLPVQFYKVLDSERQASNLIRFFAHQMAVVTKGGRAVGLGEHGLITSRDVPEFSFLQRKTAPLFAKMLDTSPTILAQMLRQSDRTGSYYRVRHNISAGIGHLAEGTINRLEPLFETLIDLSLSYELDGQHLWVQF